MIMNLSESFRMNNSSRSVFYEWNSENVADSLVLIVPLTIIYLLIFVIGFIGNIITCIVIYNNRSMHTNTNYYLFSLAISDFILLVSGVPQELYMIWFKYQSYIFGDYFCIGRDLIAETAANATVLTITAFTMERYAAICHPFAVQMKSKLRRAIRLIVWIWLVALAGAIPQAAQFGVTTRHGGIRKCTIVRVVVEHSFQISTYTFFFLPMFIILLFYILIGWHLYKRNGDDSLIIRRHQHKSKYTTALKTTQSDTILYRYVADINRFSSMANQRHLRHVTLQRKATFGNGRVLKMLVAVVICFFLCWAPFHAQRLHAVYGTKSLLPSNIITFNNTSDDFDRDNTEILNENSNGELKDHHYLFIYSLLTYSSGILYYLSTCINPLLYNLMSNKFRQAFKSTLFHMKVGKIRQIRYKTKEYTKNPNRGQQVLELQQNTNNL